MSPQCVPTLFSVIYMLYFHSHHCPIKWKNTEVKECVELSHSPGIQSSPSYLLAGWPYSSLTKMGITTTIIIVSRAGLRMKKLTQAKCLMPCFQRIPIPICNRQWRGRCVVTAQEQRARNREGLGPALLPKCQPIRSPNPGETRGPALRSPQSQPSQGPGGPSGAVGGGPGESRAEP